MIPELLRYDSFYHYLSSTTSKSKSRVVLMTMAVISNGNGCVVYSEQICHPIVANLSLHCDDYAGEQQRGIQEPAT